MLSRLKILAGVSGIVVGLGLFGLIHGFFPGTSVVAEELMASPEDAISGVYPLYHNHIAFGDKVPLSVPPRTGPNPTDHTVIGYLITSDPTATTTDISSLSEPFRVFYDQKLLKEGWSIDPTYQADRAGASVWGFKKGKEVVIFGFNSTFLNAKQNQPLECPCTVVFNILGGVLQ